MVLAISSFAGNMEIGVGKADLYAYKFAGKTYIIMSFKDDEDDYRIIASPVIRMKLFDNSILELCGDDKSQETKTNSTAWGFGFASGSVNNVHYAMFPISTEQIGLLKKGIKKIAINTIPNVYVKEYKEDKVGKAIIESFANLTDDF